MLLSVFFAWHLIAITIGSLRPPDTSDPSAEPRVLPPSRLAQALDGLAGGVWRVHTLLWRATALVHPAADAYLRLTGLAQPWAMFSNPPRYDDYLRVRYYIGRDPSRPTRVATELVMPAGREDEVRLFKAYRDSYEDKAYSIALQRFFTNLKSSDKIAANMKSLDLPDDLAPIARYYARRFTERELGAGERILRTDVWRGIAITPPPGVQPDETEQLARRAALLEYYEGPVENPFNPPIFPQYRAVDHDGDIEWLLLYFEEP